MDLLFLQLVRIRAVNKASKNKALDGKIDILSPVSPHQINSALTTLFFVRFLLGTKDKHIFFSVHIHNTTSERKKKYLKPA